MSILPWRKEWIPDIVVCIFDYMQTSLVSNKLPTKIIVSVRNPYDRIYSAYLFNQQTNHYRKCQLDNHPRIVCLKKPFLDFVKSTLPGWVTNYRQAAKERKTLEAVGIHFAPIPISIFLMSKNGKKSWEIILFGRNH